MDFDCANDITKYQPRMRKTLTILMMTLFCVMAMGQEAVKVVAKFKKGDYVVYDIKQTTTQVSDANDTHEFVIAGETRYDVIGADKTGYTIACKTQKWESQNSPENDLASNLVKSAMTMLVGQSVIMRTNLEGKIVKIENMDELRQKMEDYMDGLLDKLFSGEGMNNQDIISKEKMRKIMLDEITEEKLLESMDANDQFSLYGKTISTGTTIDQKISGLKFKTTYEVAPIQKTGVRTIKSSSVSDMTKEDIKSMIINQMEKVMPEMTETLKDSFDALAGTDIMTIEGKKKSSFDILDNGWVKYSDSLLEFKMMGSETKSHTTSVIKECSWAK